MGNYSGTTSILVNPAMMTNTHNFLDVNILSGDIFLHNNSIYIHGSDYNLVDAINGKELPENKDDVDSKVTSIMLKYKF